MPEVSLIIKIHVSILPMIPEITHVISQLIASPPEDKRCISVKEAVDLALQAQPQRYGFSTEYAHRRYRAMKRRPQQPANDLNASLWEELSEKVDNRLASHPDEDDFVAMEHVLSNERPSRYFLTPVYAEKLFYRRRRLSRSRPRQ